VKLTLTRGAIVALALAATVQAAAQTSTAARGPDATSTNAGVSTLTIDTRDTGVDLGLTRGADATAGAASPRRVEPPVDPHAGPATPTSGIVDAPTSFAPTRPTRATTPPRLPPLAPGRIDAATAAGAAAQSRAQGATSSHADGTRATVVGSTTQEAAPR